MTSDATANYPSIVAAIHTIKVDGAVLDGELVALDADGRPSFHALQHRSVRGTSLAYYAFDLLALEGVDLMHRPLAERREHLAAIVTGSRVLLSSPLPGTVAQITREVTRLELEGIVAKRRTSRVRTRATQRRVGEGALRPAARVRGRRATGAKASPPKT